VADKQHRLGLEQETPTCKTSSNACLSNNSIASLTAA